MQKISVKDRIARSITRRKGEVVLRSEFANMGSDSQIGRALRQLIAQGKIVRLGYGVYAKARPSVLSGRPVPRSDLASLAVEALRKLGVEPQLGRAQADYANGRTTQIPVRTCFNVGQRRITRKITIGKRSVDFERGKPAAGASIRRLNILWEFSEGRLAAKEAIRRLGLRDYEELLAALKESRISVPKSPPDDGEP